MIYPATKSFFSPILSASLPKEQQCTRDNEQISHNDTGYFTCGNPEILGDGGQRYVNGIAVESCHKGSKGNANYNPGISLLRVTGQLSSHVAVN